LGAKSVKGKTMGESRLFFRIGPIPCREREWREDDASAISDNNRREGKQVMT